MFEIFEKGYTVIWLSKSESKESYTEWNKPNREKVWLCLYVESKKFKFIEKDRKMRIFRNLRYCELELLMFICQWKNSVIIKCGYLIHRMVTMVNSNSWNLLGDCIHKSVN